MRNRLNKILFVFIALGLSFNALISYAVGPLAVVSVASGAIDVYNALGTYANYQDQLNERSRAQAYRNNATDGYTHDRLKGSALSKYQGSSPAIKNGKLGFGASVGGLLTLGGLVIGDYPSSYLLSVGDVNEETVPFEDNVYPDYAVGYEHYTPAYGGEPTGDTVSIQMSEHAPDSTFLDGSCGYIAYWPSGSRVSGFGFTLEPGQSQTVEPVSTLKEFRFDVNCRTSNTLVSDFDTPDIKVVPPSSIDSNGNYVDPSTGEVIPSFLSDSDEQEKSLIWDVLRESGVLPPQYSTLTYQEATEKANYLSGDSKDSVLDFEGLPVNPDYQAPTVENVVTGSKHSVVDHYNQDGTYSHSTIDHYNVVETKTDGVTTSTTETFSHRQNITDPAKTSNTGVGSQLDVSNTTVNNTYISNSAVTNSQYSSETLKQNANDNLDSGLLAQIASNTASTNTSVQSLSNQLKEQPNQPETPDFSSDVQSYENSLMTDEDVQAEISDIAFDFDAYQMAVNIFGSNTCHDLTVSKNGQTYNIPMAEMCQIWAFFGGILLLISYYAATLIVVRALRG